MDSPRIRTSLLSMSIKSPPLRLFARHRPRRVRLPQGRDVSGPAIDQAEAVQVTAVLGREGG
jgi:hypothetical protein